MRETSANYRYSSQVRAVDPDAPGELHPRAKELGEAMRDIYALGQGVAFKDLVCAGFTTSEIIEHHHAAQKHANELSERRISPAPDRLAEMIEKARAPLPNKLPLPEGTTETQPLFVAWGHYCAARAALMVDAWPGQRERCAEQLIAYLRRLPMLPRDRKLILREVGRALQNVGTPAQREAAQ
jgi:hypothetical protein